MSNPRVLSWSGDAFPDAACCSRLARAGLDDAALLTWEISSGVIITVEPKDDSKGVEEDFGVSSAPFICTTEGIRGVGLGDGSKA